MYCRPTVYVTLNLWPYSKMCFDGGPCDVKCDAKMIWFHYRLHGIWKIHTAIKVLFRLQLMHQISHDVMHNIPNSMIGGAHDTVHTWHVTLHILYVIQASVVLAFIGWLFAWRLWVLRCRGWAEGEMTPSWPEMISACCCRGIPQHL